MVGGEASTEGDIYIYIYIYIAMEFLCRKCLQEGCPLMICLKMVSIFIILLRWHTKKTYSSC